MPLKFITTTIRTDELSAARPQALGTMAIVGTASSGDEGVALLFRNTADATDVYGESSALTKAIASAFKQSPGPQEVWAVREKSSGSSEEETKIQNTAGNIAFQVDLVPVDTFDTLRARVVPSILQSTYEDHTSSSIIYRQDGAATLMMAGVTNYDNATGACNVYVVVTDKNHVAVEGATVGISFTDSPTEARCSIGASATTDEKGMVNFPVLNFGYTAAGGQGANTDDEITIWSVSGDLDSDSQNAFYSTKNGTRDDDVVITWTTALEGLSGRTTVDDGFLWFSEVERSVYAFVWDESAGVTGLGGHLGQDISASDTDINVGSMGSNISATTGTTTVAKAFDDFGVEISNSDASATFMGWGTTAYETEANTNIFVDVKDAVPAAIFTTTNDTGVGVDNTLNPILHAYDLLANMTHETLGAGEWVAAAITSATNTNTGEIFLSEELGTDDLLYIDYTAGAYASSLAALRNKEFRIIASAGRYADSDLRTFTRFVESRLDHLPTFGVWALQPKGLAGGNGKDYTISRVAQSNYISLFAHDHSDTNIDVGSAVGGAMMGLNPWDSAAFQVVQGIVNDDTNGFTGAEVESFHSAQINVLDLPLFYDTISPVISEGYSTGPRQKSDVQIMLNYIDVEIKRALSNPSLIGKSRVSFTGVRKIADRINAILSPLIQRDVIGATSQALIPLLDILAKPSSSRMATETVLVNNAQNTRIVTGEVQVDYQGSIEKINLGIRFF